MSKLKVTPCTGEGQGSCKRCTDKGKWNLNWMCFLYHIEGYEGCYCRDCVEAIQEEENQKEIDKLRNEYEYINKPMGIASVGSQQWVDNIYTKSAKQKKLRKRYIECLPKNKQLAVFLHSKLCRHYLHTCNCTWDYEIDGLDDDWSRSSHKEYLEKADKILEVTTNMDVIKKIVEVVS